VRAARRPGGTDDRVELGAQQLVVIADEGQEGLVDVGDRLGWRDHHHHVPQAVMVFRSSAWSAWSASWEISIRRGFARSATGIASRRTPAS